MFILLEELVKSIFFSLTAAHKIDFKINLLKLKNSVIIKLRRISISRWVRLETTRRARDFLAFEIVNIDRATDLRRYTFSVSIRMDFNLSAGASSTAVPRKESFFNIERHTQYICKSLRTV